MAGNDTWMFVGIGAAVLYLTYKTVQGAEKAGEALGSLFTPRNPDVSPTVVYLLSQNANTPEGQDTFKRQVKAINSRQGSPSFLDLPVPDISSTSFKKANAQTLKVLDKAGYVNAEGKIDFTKGANTLTGNSSSKQNVLAKPATGVNAVPNSKPSLAIATSKDAFGKPLTRNS